MNLEQFAQRIDGREAPITLTAEEQAIAKEGGFCVLTGLVDDTYLFVYGLVRDFIYLYDDRQAWLSEKGFFRTELSIKPSIGVAATHLSAQLPRWRIEAPQAPSADFILNDSDGDPFCQGIVVQLPSE